MSRSSSRTGTLRSALQPRLHSLVVDVWAREDAARDFSDPEGVHQMRVASRKLRAALDASDGLFSRKPERRLRSEIRRLARALGAVRDGDVMIAALRELATEGEAHPGIERLIARLEREREGARKRLLDLLDEMDANHFREASLKTFASKNGGTSSKIRRQDARSLVSEPRDRFIATIDMMPDEHDVEALHRLRINAKRLRYVLQLAEPALTPVSTQLLGPLGTMQDHLGDIHNADVLIALIRDEFHALVVDSIDRAMDGDTTPDPAARAASDDLLVLLAQAARDRHARFAAFIEWWSGQHSTGLPALLHALGAPRRGTSSSG